MPLPNQSKILLQVYEGQRRPENLLFKCEVQAPQSGINILFALDASGLLQVETNSRIMFPQLVRAEIYHCPKRPSGNWPILVSLTHRRGRNPIDCSCCKLNRKMILFLKKHNIIYYLVKWKMTFKSYPKRQNQDLQLDHLLFLISH